VMLCTASFILLIGARELEGAPYHTASAQQCLAQCGREWVT
jgi:hypothetical protein